MLKKTQRKIKVNKVIKIRLKNYFQKNTFKESLCSIKYSYIKIFIYQKYQKQEKKIDIFEYEYLFVKYCFNENIKIIKIFMKE